LGTRLNLGLSDSEWRPSALRAWIIYLDDEFVIWHVI